MNAYQTEYLNIWKQAFHEFLGWSVEQTVSWAQPLLEMMDPPGMVINEPPLYYVAREIAWEQSQFEGRSQRDREDFIRAIQSILAPDHARAFGESFDFTAARGRLDKLLIESGFKQ
jgi:hypothetical protein